MKNTKQLVYEALLVSSALMLHIFEGTLPSSMIIPGAKLGLSNIITLIALYTLPSYRQVITIIVVRLLLTSLLGSSVSGLMYSSMGAFLSFIAMLITKGILKEKVSLIGVSVIGAVSHNLGQVIIAMLVINNARMLLYFPPLALIGIITGIFIGLGGNSILPYIHAIRTHYA